MAILQEANAVFYHPLDDATEALKAAAWSGSGTFAAGKVSDAIQSPGLGFGAEAEFFIGSGTGAGQTVVTALSSGTFVVAWRDGDAPNHGKSKFGFISGTDITYGPEATFGAHNTDQMDLGTIDAQKFVVVYRDIDSAPAGFGKARVGTVSVTTISYGAVATYHSGNSASANSIAILSATIFVVIYQGSFLPSPSEIHAKVGSIAGTTIAFGALATIESAGGTSSTSAVPLTATTMVALYKNEGAASHGTARVGTVSGTDITFGLAKVFSTTTTTEINAAAISPTKLVVAYKDGNVNNGQSKVGTVSGTDITFGAASVFLVTNTNDVSLTLMSSSEFVVAYGDINDSNHGTARVGTVSGTDITYGPDTEFFAAGSAGAIGVAAFDSFKFITAYTDTLASNHGTAKVGIMAAPASLSTTATGPTAGYGPESEFLPAAIGSDELEVAVLSATKFVVAYTDGGVGLAKVGTVSGTDITYGSPTGFSIAPFSIALAALSATTFVAAHRTGGNGVASVGTVSGTGITFGADAQYLAGSAIGNALGALDATKFVVAYRDNTDFNHGTSRIGSVSGTDITYGAEVEFLSADGAVDISVSVLNAAKFVVAYRDGSASNVGAANVGTVVGTAVAYGSQATFSAGVNSAIGARSAALSSTDIVVMYRDDSDSGKGKAKVGTVAGTDVTFGAESTWASGTLTQAAGEIAALSATEFAITWTDNTDLNHGTSKIGEVSGTAIAYGVEAEFLSADGALDTRVATLTPTTFVVAYRDASDTSHGTAKVGTVDVGSAYQSAIGATRLAFSAWISSPSLGFGNTLTYGSPVEFETGAVVREMHAAMLTASKFVVVWRDSIGTDQGTARIGTVSGSAVTFGAEYGFSTKGFFPVAAALGSTRFVVAYRDQNDSNGRARVGTVTGTDITYGAESVFVTFAEGSINNNSINIAALSTAAFVVAWEGDIPPTGNDGLSRAATVAGTTISFGATVNYNDGGNADSPAMAALDSTRFVICYRDADALDAGHAKVGTVAGSAITYGAESIFNAGISSDISLAAPTSSTILVAYRDQSDSSHGKVKVGTVSGTDVTWGPETKFLADITISTSASALSPTRVFVAWTDFNASNRLDSAVAQIFGMSASFGSVSTVAADSEAGTGGSAAALSPTSAAIVYLNNGTTHGEARVATT